MKVYRVTWEERTPLTCSCCTEEKHPWRRQYCTTVDTKEEAEKFRDKVYDWSALEIRGVEIESSEVTEWRKE